MSRKPRRLAALLDAVQLPLSAVPPDVATDDATAAQHCICGAPARWDVADGLCHACASMPQYAVLLTLACAAGRHADCRPGMARLDGMRQPCCCTHHYEEPQTLSSTQAPSVAHDEAVERLTQSGAWSAGRYR